MEVFGDERPIAKEPVNIHDVLDHVRRVSETGFARGIRFVEDYDLSLPPIPASRDKLVQAFLNLVKNAAEAIGEPRDQGRIALQTAFRPGVRLSVPGSNARVSLPLMIAVEDNGPGVPEHIKPHLFDPSSPPSGAEPDWGSPWSPRSSATTAASSSASPSRRKPCFAFCCRSRSGRDRRHPVRRGRPWPEARS